MTFKKILCAIGHEGNSRAVFETAVRLARESHGFLYLNHVLPLPNSIVGEAVLIADREAAEDSLVKLAAQVPAGIGRSAIVKFGHPAREIAAAARRLGADVIVMGAPGRSAVARFFKGSVAEKVLKAAPCPVLALPPEPEARALATPAQAA
jgi:nucleotide-binding universal stress UspA family protein